MSGDDAAFRDGLIAALPSLRAFAYSLLHDWDHADDLVQETITRAWAKRDRFERGTNLNAWLFTILRNGFFSAYRRKRREVEDPDGTYAARMKIYPDQQPRVDYGDFQRALQELRPHQREALLFVTAEGLSYDEAAAVCGVSVGTIKSRVFRARERLGELLGVEGEDDLRPDPVIKAAAQE